MKSYKDTYQEEEPKMASDSAIAYTESVTPLDALWTLILGQAEDVQKALEVRLRNLLVHRQTHKAVPYTLEELHDRISLSEQQFANDETITNEEANKELEKLFASWS